MNQKKAKLIRKHMRAQKAWTANEAPIQTTHVQVGSDAQGKPLEFHITNPIRYAPNSQRRLYQQLKHASK